jgi:geranylgeranyl diphosphate synthase, type II
MLPLMHLLSVAQGSDQALVREYLHLKRSERSPELVRTVSH